MPSDEPDFSNVRFAEGGGGPLQDKPPAAPQLKPEVPRPGPPPPRSRGKAAADTVPIVETGDLADNVKGFVLLMALPMQMFDHHADGSSCANLYISYTDEGPQLTREAAAFANSLAVVAADNKYLKAFFNAGDAAGKWVALALSVQPLVMAMMNNHMRQEVEYTDEFGNSPLA